MRPRVSRSNASFPLSCLYSLCEQDGEGEIKLFLTSTTNSPSTGPGFGYKTVKSKAQIYFYYDPARFPEGKEDTQVASAIQPKRHARALRVLRQTAPF